MQRKRPQLSLAYAYEVIYAWQRLLKICSGQRRAAHRAAGEVQVQTRHEAYAARPRHDRVLLHAAQVRGTPVPKPIRVYSRRVLRWTNSTVHPSRPGYMCYNTLYGVQFMSLHNIGH